LRRVEEKRTGCGGEASDWNWLQVVELEERRIRKSVGERGGTGGVYFVASEEFRRPLVVETVMKRHWQE
jgi:hypothetical protein